MFCPSAYNPADFYIKNLVIKCPADEQRIKHMIDIFNGEYAVNFNFTEVDYDGLILKKKYSVDSTLSLVCFNFIL